jgi:Flp pilus assembly protein TadG
MRRRQQSGGALIETALFLPILFLLLVGMIEIAKIIITYYSLQKALYTVARYAGTQQGINLCDAQDASLVAAKQLATTGTTDGSGPVLIQGLTADRIEVRVERYSADTGEITECACSIEGCDAAAGGTGPDFIVVRITDGYSVRPVFPLFQVDAFPLRPRVRVPFGGT